MRGRRKEWKFGQQSTPLARVINVCYDDDGDIFHIVYFIRCFDCDSGSPDAEEKNIIEMRNEQKQL